MNWQEGTGPFSHCVFCHVKLRFRWHHMTKQKQKWISHSIKTALRAWSVLWLSGAKGLCRTAAGWGLLEMGAFARRPPRLWGALWLCLCALCIRAACAPIDCNPPFSAFSSCFHFPKSIYEGNFGCGYLKERRASGLVFCENTTSVYRALFVSSPVFFLLLF